LPKIFSRTDFALIFALLSTENAEGKANRGEFSSAGSEHLPYKQRVGGSNPSTPTKSSTYKVLFLFVPTWCPTPNVDVFHFPSKVLVGFKIKLSRPHSYACFGFGLRFKE
jgi:hypothetical protein